MIRDQLLAAMRDSIPFVIEMTNGVKYTVVRKYQVSVGPARAIVIDDAADVGHLVNFPEVRAITALSPKTSGE